MKDYRMALDSFDVAEAHLADLHDALIKLTGSNWAAECLLSEYQTTAVEYHEALKELERFGIRSGEEAACALYREKEGIAEYNEFSARASKDPLHEQVTDYAVNGYFKALPEQEKVEIAKAYARIERNMALDGDYKLVMDYYKRAEADYKEGVKVDEGLLEEYSKKQGHHGRKGVCSMDRDKLDLQVI